MASEFGDLLSELRLSAGKSMGQLARHLGVSVTYVSDVELGRRAPFTIERIRDAADLLEVSPIRLMIVAAKTRGAFELNATAVSDRGREVGAALMREWENLSDLEFAELDEVLRKLKGSNE